MSAVRAGYKQTEVGVIPVDWDAVQLGQLGKFKNGINKPSEAFGHGSPFVNLMDIFGVSSISSSESLSLLDTNSTEQQTYDLRSGDVIFVRSSVKPSGVGLTAVVTESLPRTVYSGFLIRFRDEGALVAGFKQHCFYEQGFRRRLIGQSSVSANTNINQDNLKQLFLALPPTKAEQEAIAEALSDADALIESLEQLLTKKRHLKQAAMQELLTGKKRLPGFSREWEFKRLDEVLVRLANGVLYQPSNSSGCPVTRIETIADGTIDMSRVGYAAQTLELEEYRMQVGDILFSHINSIDHIGKVAIYNGELPLYHGMNLLLLRAGKSLSSRFLFYWLGSHAGRSKAVTLARQAVSQASINTSDLRQVEIPFPLMPEQTAIATILSDMDAEIAELESQLAKTRAIKQGMMQKLLTGEIRLL